MRRITLLFLSLGIFISAFAQHVITGRVTDEKGVGLEGITVREKGGTAGTSTDKNGYYTLKVNSSGATLIFSGVGLVEKEGAVSGGSLDISLSPSTVALGNIELVGTRNIKRSATETAVPVDVIPVAKIASQTGMVEINSLLHYLAPSFNANRQSGSDGADHIDPATIRGMGPDQTLVLINGKRWHQTSLVNLYGTRGRGNTGTDLNAIPAAAIERIEILRDGASAQYGSDAIAGVINIILKQNVKEFTVNAMAGTQMTGYGKSLDSPAGKILDNTTDGFQYNANVNYGFSLKDGGFLNLTGDVLHKNKTYRPTLNALYPDDYRTQFGEGSYNNYSAYFNNAIKMTGNAEFYSFGGVNYRDGDAFAWTRDPGSERNVTAIYPNGFNPHIQSKITDLALSMGVRANIGAWKMDFNGTTGSNRFHYEVDKTLNASLEASSPTHFDAGGFQLSQSTIGVNFNRPFNKVAKGLNLAMGIEVRYEQYQIFKGEVASWKQYGPVVFAINGTDTTFRPGGSQGFPGFQPKDEVRAGRNNVGAYIDAELDVTDSWLLAGAIRVEDYSDFGFTENIKVATRIKADPNGRFNLRGSFSTGFRAPSLPQIYFSSTFTNVAAGQIVDQVIAPNRSSLTQAVGIPRLKEETSNNLGYGFVANPVKGLNVTVDGYSVKVKNRIVLTGLFDTGDDVIGGTLEDLGVGAAQFFTNAVNTTTNGVDIIATYNTKLGRGRLNVTGAANFNKMIIDEVKTTEKLAGKEDTYFGPREEAFLLASAPKHKIGLSIDYTINKFTALLRFTHFSALDLVNWNDEVDHFDDKLTTDLTLSMKVTPMVNVAIGGNNILDVYPNHHDPGLSESGGMWDAVQMGYGGAFYFVKVGVRIKK